MLVLRPRLKAAAELINPGKKTVDVGTDHAYLPAFLVLNGISKNVLACDIGELPLKNAAKTLEIYRLQNDITLRISNGLVSVLPDEAEEISICGMGGTLIRDILNASAWVKKSSVHLVLQPMTHSEDVRRYLCENGFYIDKELCLFDGGRVYCCISAYYTGKNCEYNPGYWYFGELLNEQGIAQKYVQKQFLRVKKRFEAISGVNRFPEEQLLLKNVLTYYKENKYDS